MQNVESRIQCKTWRMEVLGGSQVLGSITTILQTFPEQYTIVSRHQTATTTTTSLWEASTAKARSAATSSALVPVPDVSETQIVAVPPKRQKTTGPARCFQCQRTSKDSVKGFAACLWSDKWSSLVTLVQSISSSPDFFHGLIYFVKFKLSLCPMPCIQSEVWDSLPLCLCFD